MMLTAVHGKPKKSLNSKRRADFGHLILPRKQRIGRRSSKLEILFHTELMKEEQNITAKHLSKNSESDIQVNVGCIAGNETIISHASNFGYKLLKVIAISQPQQGSPSSLMV